jgi:DNA-binding LytR/AlgR family response regulator
MAEAANGNPDHWDSRRRGRDGAGPAGTSGDAAGTSGPAAIARILVVTLALLAGVSLVNVLTQLDDARHHGQKLAPIVPIVTETTSAVCALLTFPVIYLALRLAPPTRRPWLRTAPIHLAASVVFSALHVLSMELMRQATFAMLRLPYRWSLADWPYEYRKDLLSYVVVAGAFWLLRAPGLRGERTRAAPDGEPKTFDIRDGAAVLRVAIADIVAAQAAGNYVEFWLADGRRPLTRAPLRQVESALTPAGFVRTHRSWLVNPRRVRAIAPAGSGDFRVDLDGGVSAPLSRRFPEALATLREPG